MSTLMIMGLMDRRKHIINGIMNSLFSIKKSVLRKKTRGAVSVFLCIVLSPFIMLATVLVEASRIQENNTIASEIIDNATLSTLADYDQYLHNRFGLFAVSQESDISDRYSHYLNENLSSILGKEAQQTHVAAAGSMPLSYEDVLKQQLLDFSETTEVIDLVLSDFNLDDWIGKFDKSNFMTQFAECMDVIDAVAEGLEKIASSTEILIDSMQTLTDQLGALKNAMNDVADRIALLYQKVLETGSIPNPANTDELIDFISDWYNEIESIYQSFINLKPVLAETEVQYSDFIEKLNGVVLEANSLKDKMLEIADVSPSVPDGSEEESVADSSDQISEGLDNIGNYLLDSIDAAAEEFNTGFKPVFDEAIQSIKNSINTTFHVDAYQVSSVNFFVDDEGNLTATGQIDLLRLVFLLNSLNEVWNTGGLDGIKTYLVNSLFVSIDNLQVFISDYIETLKYAVEDAEKQVQTGFIEQILKVLPSLVKLLDNIFSLKLFIDGNLNAYVAGMEDDEFNAYMSFEKSIIALVDSVKELKGLVPLNDEGEFDVTAIRPFSLFTSVISMGKSIVYSIKFVFDLVYETGEKIVEYVSWVSNPRAIYDKLLIVQYFTDNLPNRVTMNKINNHEYDFTGEEPLLTMKGEGRALTGFKYADLPVPSHNWYSSALGNIAGIADTINGKADQNMFFGAELEYMIAGCDSELMNQLATFLNIFTIRVLLNAGPVFLNEQVKEIAGPLFFVYFIILAAESLVDTILLCNGAEIPVWKSTTPGKQFLYCTPSGVPALVEDLCKYGMQDDTIKEQLGKIFEGVFEDVDKVGKDGFMSLDYASYCALVMISPILVTPGPTADRMMRRFGKLVDMEAKAYYAKNGQEFDINRAYTVVRTRTRIEVNRFAPLAGFNSKTFGSNFIMRDRSY